MIPRMDISCIRCNGAGYEDDGIVACLNCGRMLLAFDPPPSADTPVSSPRLGNCIPKRYEEAYKRGIVDRLAAGESIGKISRETGVNEISIRRWRSKFASNSTSNNRLAESADL